MKASLLLREALSSNSLTSIVAKSQGLCPPFPEYRLSISSSQLDITLIKKPAQYSKAKTILLDEGFESDVDSISLISSDDSFTSSTCLVEDHVLKNRESDSANGSSSSESETEVVTQSLDKKNVESVALSDVLCYTDVLYPKVLVFIVKNDVLVFSFDHLEHLQSFYNSFNTLKAVTNQRTYAKNLCGRFNLLQRTDNNGITHIEISREPGTKLILPESTEPSSIISISTPDVKDPRRININPTLAQKEFESKIGAKFLDDSKVVLQAELLSRSEFYPQSGSHSYTLRPKTSTTQIQNLQISKNTFQNPNAQNNSNNHQEGIKKIWNTQNSFDHKTPLNKIWQSQTSLQNNSQNNQNIYNFNTHQSNPPEPLKRVWKSQNSLLHNSQNPYIQQNHQNISQTSQNISQTVQNISQTVQNISQTSQNISEFPENIPQNQQNISQNPYVSQSSKNISQNFQNNSQNPKNILQNPQNTLQHPKNTLQHHQNTYQNPQNTSQTNQNIHNFPSPTIPHSDPLKKVWKSAESLLDSPIHPSRPERRRKPKGRAPPPPIDLPTQKQHNIMKGQFIRVAVDPKKAHETKQSTHESKTNFQTFSGNVQTFTPNWGNLRSPQSPLILTTVGNIGNKHLPRAVHGVTVPESIKNQNNWTNSVPRLLRKPRSKSETRQTTPMAYRYIDTTSTTSNTSPTSTNSTKSTKSTKSSPPTKPTQPVKSQIYTNNTQTISNRLFGLSQKLKEFGNNVVSTNSKNFNFYDGTTEPRRNSLGEMTYKCGTTESNLKSVIKKQDEKKKGDKKVTFSAYATVQVV